MLGKPSADDLHHGSEIAFANVLWDICEGVGTVENHCPRGVS